MVQKPVVFISATSDFSSARDLVGRVLYSMGYEPVWQEIEATDGGELLAVLRKRIEPCAMLVQLVGNRYGAEPPGGAGEFGRVSYTQYEALYAEKVGKKVIYHFIDATFPTDAATPEEPEKAGLQTAYRKQIKDANKLRHSNIASAQDLELSIRRISDELAEVRKQSDQRYRKMAWLAGGAVAGVALVVGMVFVVMNRQAGTDVKTAQVKDELAALRTELRAAVSPKPLAQGQTAPEPLSPELIAKAKILLESGNAEDQALAKTALHQFDEANRIIQELKAKPNNPIDEAFRLLTMEGDNWYQAGQADKAIEPFEKALALRPDDIKARNSLALAHTFAKLGDIAAHDKRAIEIAEGALKLVKSGSADWAMTQNNLGNAWQTMPTGDKGENLRQAIVAYEAALTVYTKETDPDNWATTQNNLGSAWWSMPTGDKGENLRQAIAAYESALTVRTKEADPNNWAMTQNNLGIASADIPTGDKGENLRQAIAAYEAALRVFTKEADPGNWARTQNNLGNAWQTMPTGDKGENLRKAIAASEAALTVYTKDADPNNWAMTQNNLGNAWQTMPTGDREENLRQAIAAYEAAQTVDTKEADPSNWAATQNNLGNAWWSMRTGDKGENLRKAIGAYEAALTVRTKEADPNNWAMTQNNLGNAWQTMPTGDKGENLRQAIVAYEAALTVYAKEADPNNWAMTQNDLGIAWDDMPTGDKGENLRKAIGAYEAALTVYTKEADPNNWAATQNNLGNALADMADVKGEDKVAWLERAIASDKAALLVRTAEAFPREHADTEKNMAIDKEAYVAAGGEAVKPFDAIEPAK